MTSPNAVGRADLAGAVAAREVADHAYHRVAHTGDRSGTLKTRLDDARHLVILAMAVRRWAVISELAAGASVEEVAEALGLNVATVRAQFGVALAAMADQLGAGDLDPDLLGDQTTGSGADAHPESTADAVDLWLLRHIGVSAGALDDVAGVLDRFVQLHAEPWDETVPDPVSRALHA